MIIKIKLCDDDCSEGNFCRKRLASATSAGGGLGCAMGPVIKEYYVQPPYKLLKNISYKLKIEFNSGDGLYHVNSYYQANFSPDISTSISWTTTHNGTLGDPWVITNNGNNIRFNLDNSENCGGSNPNTQSGTAECTVLNTTSDIMLGFNFEGIAELQETGYENISFYLSGV
jgi:hypothetical protein